MAPIIVRRVLESSVRTALDASQPKLSRRLSYYGSSSSAAVFIVPIAIFIALVLLVCCIWGRRKHTAKTSANIHLSPPRDLGPPSWSRRAPAPVPPPVSEDVLDPPPPYIPLQTLAPAHKPVDDTLERPADTEGNVGNHGQVRSMLDV